MKQQYLFLLLIIIVGCSDSDTSSIGGDGLSGTLAGMISMKDYRGRVKADKSGVLVTLDGTPYSALTDSDGNWKINSLPSRTYSISFSKPGCYIWRDLSYSFTAGGFVRYFYLNKNQNGFYIQDTVPMGELPRYQIILDAIVMTREQLDSTHSLLWNQIYGHSSNDTPNNIRLSAYIITGPSPDLSLEIPSSYRNGKLINIIDGGFIFNNSATHDTVANLLISNYSRLFDGFAAGDTIYFRVYPSINDNYYYNAIEDRQIPVGYSMNGSNVLSVILK